MSPEAAAQIDREQIDYTSHADAYDERRFTGKWFEYLEDNRRRAVLRVLGAGGLDRRILDAGCGTGRGLMYFASAGFTDLSGIDYTGAMLLRARQKLDADCPSIAVPLARGNAFSLPVPDDAFDVVVSLNVLHLFPFEKQVEVVSEFHRICRPGGLVLVELENIHKGLFFNRYGEQKRHQDTTKLNNMRETKSMLSRDLFSDVRILGVELPVVHRFFQHVPAIGRQFERLTYYPPVKWLAARMLVSGRPR